MSEQKNNTSNTHEDDNSSSEPVAVDQSKEVGGRQGPEPTRYGDWEKKGRCIDF